MPETIKKTWLQDKDSTKLAPPTTIDNVFTSDGSKRWVNEYQDNMDTKLDKTGGTITGNLHIIQSGHLYYDNIENGTAEGRRPIWFGDSNNHGKPVKNNDFTYDPKNFELRIGKSIIKYSENDKCIKINFV